MSDTARFLLLRHGEVTSHRGDVSVTDGGLETARAVGRRLAAANPAGVRLLSGSTARTKQTAGAIGEGFAEHQLPIVGPSVAFGLRNPDLYLGGDRVDMGSTLEFFAQQTSDLTAEQAANVPFFADFVAASDRIGWWLRHDSPPGDSAAAVATRVRQFVASLADYGPDAPVTVGVTHSPILRAIALEILGSDPGEPEWLAGVSGTVASDGTVTYEWLDSAP